MNSNTTIKILLRSPHLNRNAKPLQHLPNSQTQDMQTNHFLLRSGADDLHLRWVLFLLFVGEEVVEHVREAGFVDFDFVVAEALAGLGFCETDCAYFGVGEDYGGDVFVGEFCGFEFGGSEETAA
jgi:hypothetical protein